MRSGSTRPPTHCPRDPRPARGTPVNQCAALPVSRHPVGLSPAREIEDDLARFRPDVVHLATEFAMGLVGLKAAQRLGIPIIASAHTDYQKYAERYGVPGCSRWDGSTDAGSTATPARCCARRAFTKIPAHQGHPAHRAVDPRTRSGAVPPGVPQREYRRSFGVGPDDLLVTYIGRLAKEKDIARLLTAWRGCAGRGNAQLVLVGRGPLAAELARAPVPGVHLTGLKQGRDLSEAYASADLIRLPFVHRDLRQLTARGDGFRCGFAGGGGGGVLEFARHDDNAMLVRPRDTQAWATGWQQLLGDGDLRRRLAEAGLRTAADRPWGPIYDQLLADYRWVAEMREARAA